MRTSHLYLSALHFILVAFLFLVGLFFLLGSKVSYTAYAWKQFVEASPDFFFSTGIALLSFALLLFLSLRTIYSRVFYKVKISSSPVEVDPNLIHSYVTAHMKELSPVSPVALEVFINKKQTIEIIAKLPSNDVHEHQLILQELEKGLPTLFAEKLGYKRDVLFSVVLAD